VLLRDMVQESQVTTASRLSSSAQVFIERSEGPVNHWGTDRQERGLDDQMIKTDPGCFIKFGLMNFFFFPPGIRKFNPKTTWQQIASRYCISKISSFGIDHQLVVRDSTSPNSLTDHRPLKKKAMLVG